MRASLTFLVAGAAMLGATLPARAVTVIDTYTGTVLTNNRVALFYPGNSNNDNTGIFGTPSMTGNDIAGQAFTAVITTNLALAPNTAVDPTTHDIDSAYTTAIDSPTFSTVTVTINGKSASFGENYGTVALPSELAQGGEFQQARLIYSSTTCCTGDQIDLQVTPNPRFSFNFPNSLTTPGTYSVQPSGDWINLFAIQTTYPGPLIYTRGFLNPTSLTVAIAGVPEPAAWAVYLAGFGVIGGIVRRRSRRLATGWRGVRGVAPRTSSDQSFARDNPGPFR